MQFTYALVPGEVGEEFDEVPHHLGRRELFDTLRHPCGVDARGGVLEVCPFVRRCIRDSAILLLALRKGRALTDIIVANGFN